MILSSKFPPPSVLFISVNNNTIHSGAQSKKLWNHPWVLFSLNPYLIHLANIVSINFSWTHQTSLTKQNKSRVNNLLVSILVSTTPPQSTHLTKRAQIIILPHKSDYVTCQANLQWISSTVRLKNLTMESKNHVWSNP